MNNISKSLLEEQRDKCQTNLDLALAMPIDHPDREAYVQTNKSARAYWQHQIDMETAGLNESDFTNYRNREIIDFVNSFLISIKLTYNRPGPNPHTDIIAHSQRGARYLVVGYSGMDKTFIVRGVLKEKRRGAGIGVLCNGQASRNALQIRHFDESTCVVPPAKNLYEYIAKYGRP